MDSHMYHAHGQDRRKPAEEQTPPPPEKRERRTPKPAPKEGEQETRKGSRWFARPES
jgi:hypothetical protein